MYSKLPEMRLFWIFLPLLFLGFFAALTYLPAFFRTSSVLFFLTLAIVVLVNNLQLAKSNLEIKTEHKQFDSIIQNLNSGAIFYDYEFKIGVFNKTAERIFGLRASEILGQIMTPDKARDPKLNLLAQVIYPSLASKMITRSEPGADSQIIDLSFDEPRLELRVFTVKLSGERDMPLGFLKLVHDRTREAGLLRSKSEFITIAAHQLRTPITAIKWSLEALSQNGAISQEDKEMATTGLTAANKLEGMVSDLLDVSKIEEGRYGYNFENADITVFMEKVLTDAAKEAERRKIELFFERPREKSITLRFDPARMGMAMSNILDNAIKYNVENGQIVVKIEKLTDKPLIQISVKDTGIGIPPDQIQNLFKKFFRGENVVKFETEGTGLGLYIVKNIIQRHGGEIWAESELNRGTTVYFTLPTDSSLIPQQEIATFGEE
ncbi:MAG: Multi-sensor signal transduction histidine kinase [Parcubacteria group bacterium GW2011_GWB1_45_9]|nr:MAG: Multi-sensor signal transduction histidine kinase [Parcubacteria group bacterium GW2011_GWB1_45_9]